LSRNHSLKKRKLHNLRILIPVAGKLISLKNRIIDNIFLFFDTKILC